LFWGIFHFPDISLCFYHFFTVCPPPFLSS
jgi:hypothetical protein